MKWVLPIGCAFILVAALASSEGAQAAARGSAARPQSAEPGSGIPGTLETLEPRPGVTERVAVVPAAGEAKASLILFVGGNGRIGLEPDNVGRPFGNFLARTRGLFAGQGLEVALLDSPSDHRELDDWRASAAPRLARGHESRHDIGGECRGAPRRRARGGAARRTRPHLLGHRADAH